MADTEEHIFKQNILLYITDKKTKSTDCLNCAELYQKITQISWGVLMT